MRTTATAFDNIPGKLPRGSVKETDVEALTTWAIAQSNDLQTNALSGDAIWRDLFAFTDTFRTIVGKDKILACLPSRLIDTRCSVFKPTATPATSVAIGPASWIDVYATFTFLKGKTRAHGRAILSVTRNDDGIPYLWLIRTWLDHFDGRGIPEVPRRPADDEVKPTKPMPYDVIIIGGGQAGLSAAGRLQALGIRYLVLEKHKVLGDVWRKRYSSLRWHTPKEYGNLPFGRMFADDIPELVPTKTIGNAHEAWAKKHSINALTDCAVESARYESQHWIVKARSAGREEIFRAKNLVLAIGPATTHPIRPSWATPEAVQASGFRGKILHAVEYDSCEDWVGKGARGVTVGTANTGHDIAEDMANAGMQTTMLQRGATFVLPGEWLLAAEGAHYNTRISNDVADREQSTMPLKLVREMANTSLHAGIQANPARFDALEKAGFKLDRFGDLLTNIFDRFGGHYIDTGASARIANGEIKMETTPVLRLVADGLELEDGRILGCDLIVLATGYEHDFRKDAARILGGEIADQMDNYFNLDFEGEIRGYAKYAGVPHLWYFGGDVRSTRFMSRFVALQIQAQLLESSG